MDLFKQLNFEKLHVTKKKKKFKMGSAAVECLALFIYCGYYTNLAD